MAEVSREWGGRPGEGQEEVPVGGRSRSRRTARIKEARHFGIRAMGSHLSERGKAFRSLKAVFKATAPTLRGSGGVLLTPIQMREEDPLCFALH